jgi:hypothetical protein
LQQHHDNDEEADENVKERNQDHEIKFALSCRESRFREGTAVPKPICECGILLKVLMVRKGTGTTLVGRFYSKVGYARNPAIRFLLYANPRNDGLSG